MGITAESGPVIVYGFTQTSSGQVTEYNEERGPSMNDLGQGMLDPRAPYTYQPGAAVGTKVRGFWNGYAAVDQIPGTISTNCIALAQAPTSSGFILTLCTCSSVNSVITNNVVITPPEGGAPVTMPIGIDMGTATSSNNGLQSISFGSGGTINLWDPRAMVARTISWTGSSGGSSGELGVTLWVAGRDVYGFKMTEAITGSSSSASAGAITYKGKKAFKYISGCTLTTTGSVTGSTLIIVGVNDTYGFPMRVDNAGYTTVWWGSSQINNLVTLSSLGHTFASTATATSTTGDVRGTFTSTGASNSSGSSNYRLIMFVTPSAQNLPTTSFSDTTGLFGVTQFSSV